MEEYYETSMGFGFSEEDDFENGCLDGGHIFDLGIQFKSSCVRELIEQIKAHYGVDDDEIMLNSCKDIGRIDIQKLEDGDSRELTKANERLWKQGKIKAYNVIYTYYVYKVQREEVDLNDI